MFGYILLIIHLQEKSLQNMFYALR